VLWPEDVVDVDGDVVTTPKGNLVGALADRLDTTLVAGVVESGEDHFRNFAVAWGPEGTAVARYEKNVRVPFGEWIPFRSIVENLADVSAVPRDAAVGHGPGILHTPAGDLGVIISWEVFFARRARAAINAGGRVLLVPTNASSFGTNQMPEIELAVARLRALETGRWVLQAAPTGFSAVVDPDGRVHQHSDLGARAVIQASVPMRTGRTPYTLWGDLPVVVLALVALGATFTLRATASPDRR
jgi:apolipoprotein N-acyltransferase